MSSRFISHVQLSLSLVILIVVGCSLEASNDNKSVMETAIISSVIEDELIDGEWTCCARSRNGMRMTANVCSNVIFESDNKGQYIPPSGEQVLFNWELLNDSTITVSSNKSIDGGTYQMSFIEKPEYMELQLIHTDKDLIYYLGR
jgi:hypothetical protein